MASADLQLCSRIIRTGDMKSVMEWGITLDDFRGGEGHALFNSLIGYFSMPDTSGSVLGPNVIYRLFPNFQICDDISMTTPALCKEVRANRLRIDLLEQLQKAGGLATGDPMVAVNNLQGSLMSLQNIGYCKNTDIPFYDSFSKTMSKMELMKQGHDFSIASWPWYPIQEATGGIQPDDYIVVYGRPKSMKTWVLAYLIGWLYDMGKSLLIYTKEMTADNIFQRIGAILARVRYHEFKTHPLQLTFEENYNLRAVERMLYNAQRAQTVICLSAKDASEGGDTVPWLRAKVDRYKPQVVAVDGFYLMSDVHKARKPNEKVANISRALRQLVLDTGVPVLATVQANRDAAKNQEANLDEVAFSDAISQDATLLMRAINEKNSPTIALVMGQASREFDLSGFRIYGIPAVNFDYHSELTDKDIEKAKEQDKTGESGNSKATPATAKKKKKEEEEPKPVTEGDALKTATKQVASYLNPRI